MCVVQIQNLFSDFFFLSLCLVGNANNESEVSIFIGNAVDYKYISDVTACCCSSCWKVKLVPVAAALGTFSRTGLWRRDGSECGWRAGWVTFSLLCLAKWNISGHNSALCDEINKARSCFFSRNHAGKKNKNNWEQFGFFSFQLNTTEVLILHRAQK